MKDIKLEHNQVYYVDQRPKGTKCHWIVKYNENGVDSFIRIHYEEFDHGRFGLDGSIERYEVRLATAQERIWLDKCIEEDEYVPMDSIYSPMEILDIF